MANDTQQFSLGFCLEEVRKKKELKLALFWVSLSKHRISLAVENGLYKRLCSLVMFCYQWTNHTKQETNPVSEEKKQNTFSHCSFIQDILLQLALDCTCLFGFTVSLKMSFSYKVFLYLLTSVWKMGLGLNYYWIIEYTVKPLTTIFINRIVLSCVSESNN